MQPRHTGSTEALRLRALVTVARAVGDATADDRRLARLVVDLVVGLVGDGATIWLPSADQESLIRAGAAHSDPATSQRLSEGEGEPTLSPRGDGLIAAVLESGAPAVLSTEEVAAHLKDLEPELAPWGIPLDVASMAIVPLRGEARVAGVLVAARDPGAPEYGTDDVDFLQALADVAVSTLAIADKLNGSAAAVDEMRRQSDLVDQVSDVIMAWDLEDGVITWNAAAERVYHYSVAEALGCDVDTLLATRYIAIDGEELTQEQVIAAVAETNSWSGELRQRRADGEVIEILSSVGGLLDWHGRLTGAVAVNRDVTDQRHKEQLALRDVLTGLPNRRFLIGHLRDALARCAAGSGPLAVLFLDLDGFKLVNDTLGHDAGDEVLRVTAQRLDQALRRHDVVTRLGGDEFVAVTEEVGGRVNAEDVANRLLESASLPIEVTGGAVTVRPSIGVTMVQPERAALLTPAELISEADAAMYVAKRLRSGFAFFG